MQCLCCELTACSSRSSYCRVPQSSTVALDGNAKKPDCCRLTGKGVGAASNCSRFPDKLDITLRTDTGSVLSSITPAPGTCILKLSLAAHATPQEQRSQRSRLLDLLHGLSSKSKTGVVERLPLPDETLCQLYLIPPSSSVAQRLGVDWSKDECLFGLLALQRQH